MPSTDLHRALWRMEQDKFESFEAEKARVATTANNEDDDVFVTLPNSESPNTRRAVTWRVGVQFVDGVAQPRYPERGDDGIVIYTDEGEAWLIW